MLSKAQGFDFMITETEHEALILEDNLIKKHQPVYNRLLKADNSYVYIKITKSNWPQIFLTRQRTEDGSTYI
jgi:excinuclease ABC subunit C